MKELLKEVWILSFKNGRADHKEIIEKFGREEIEKAKSRGLIEIAGEEVRLTEKGREKINVVLAGGVFDILHPGHVFFLSKAKELGDILIVVVARDSTVEKRKRIPIVPGKQRVEMVKALKPVDLAVLGKSENIFNILEDIKPDVIALGQDQHHIEKEVEDEAEKRGLKVKAVRIKEFRECELSSTRAILQKIIDRNFPINRQRREEK